MIMNVALFAWLECSQKLMALKAEKSLGALRQPMPLFWVCLSQRSAPCPAFRGSCTISPALHSPSFSKPKACRVSSDQAARAAWAAVTRAALVGAP
jgi:hypothetical protein